MRTTLDATRAARAVVPPSASRSTTAAASPPPALAEALHLLPAPAAVLDGAGAALFANPPFARLLDDEPRRAALREEIARLVRSLRFTADHGDVEAGALDGRYRLHARWITHEGDGFALLVASRHDAPAGPCDAVLKARYGLTRTEIRVARLMAEGRSNRGVAAALCISPHTARHHAEHIMAKMSVATRAGVGARLRGDTTEEGSG